MVAARHLLPRIHNKQSFTLDSFCSRYCALVTNLSGVFICAETGDCLGLHEGLELYTIGQGARLAGGSERWFVTAKDPSTGSITVAPGTEHPALMTDSLTAAVREFSWVAGQAPAQLLAGQPLRVQYKVSVMFYNSLAPYYTKVLYSLHKNICIQLSSAQHRGNR
jgi:tRNA U34 2-thiouridine synthase MnmA/TrmU